MLEEDCRNRLLMVQEQVWVEIQMGLLSSRGLISRGK